MIKVTEETIVIRGNMPQILDDIMNLFKTLRKNSNRFDRLMFLYLLDELVDLFNPEED